MATGWRWWALAGLAAVAVLAPRPGRAVSWLSLQHSKVAWPPQGSADGAAPRGGPCGAARRRFGLARAQARVCRRDPRVMPHVEEAARAAAGACARAFARRRWNCSSVETAPALAADLTRGTREQAYVYAISSAALVYTMARACANGALHQCTCANQPNGPPDGNFRWGGCGDNVHWGANFAKRFVDDAEKLAMRRDGAASKKRKTRVVKRKKNGEEETGGEKKKGAEGGDVQKSQTAAVNLHNNRVGRRVVVESLRTQCKCHGVSGSCNVKTCWRSLPSLALIGQKLMQRYTVAREVPQSYVLDYGHAADVPGKRAPTREELVYISKSPDYCTRDRRLGSYGTVGRQCNVTSNGTESCRDLCCGRGYRTVVDEKIERCHCKFYNCCYVKCNICRTMTQVFECL